MAIAVQDASRYVDLLRFFRAALAPSFPRAARVLLGRCNRSLSPCRSRRFLNVSLRSGVLFFCGHSFTEPDLPNRLFCVSRVVLHLSVGAFVCALPSSRRPIATVESVGVLRSSRVSTTLALTLSDGSRA